MSSINGPKEMVQKTSVAGLKDIEAHACQQTVSIARVILAPPPMPAYEKNEQDITLPGWEANFTPISALRYPFKLTFCTPGWKTLHGEYEQALLLGSHQPLVLTQVAGMDFCHHCHKECARLCLYLRISPIPVFTLCSSDLEDAQFSKYLQHNHVSSGSGVSCKGNVGCSILERCQHWDEPGFLICCWLISTNPWMTSGWPLC